MINDNISAFNLVDISTSSRFSTVKVDVE